MAWCLVKHSVNFTSGYESKFWKQIAKYIPQFHPEMQVLYGI
jgi:hypothetical protein